MRDLGTLGGTESHAYGINSQGQVVVTSYNWALGEIRAFLWEEGRNTALGTLPGGTYSEAWGINSRGQAVGWSSTASSELHAVLWSK